MISLAILETEDENIAYKIASHIAGTGNRAPGVLIAAASSPDGIAGARPDLVVVSPGTRLPEAPGGDPIRCGALLLPDGAPTGRFEPGCVVNYGMSPRDTVTFSSIGETECVISLQRELPTLDGGVLDQQEFIVRRDGGTGVTLAKSGALLIMGLEPE